MGSGGIKGVKKKGRSEERPFLRGTWAGQDHVTSNSDSGNLQLPLDPNGH